MPRQGVGRERRFLEGWMSDRSQLLEVLVGAAVLAFGINLLSARIASRWPGGSLWVGVACTVAPVVYLGSRLARSRQRTESFRGLFVTRTGASDDDGREGTPEPTVTAASGVDSDSVDEPGSNGGAAGAAEGGAMTEQAPLPIVAVPGYTYGFDVAKYIEALFVENPAFRRLWEDQPLDKIWDRADDASTGWHSIELIEQATEYWVMNELSLRLSEHFESAQVGEENKLRRFARSDIPDVLLENRFLRLFSEPIEERPGFTERLGIRRGDTLVSAFGEGGMYYDRFELVLPKGSQVTRVGPATIRVATGRFVFTFAVDFSGYGANLPSGFEELYLNDHEVDAYSVTLRTQTKLTWRGLLS